MPLKLISLCCLYCFIAVPTWAETDSNAASFAALQMRLLLSEQQGAEEKPVITAEIEATEIQLCDDKVEKVSSLLKFIPGEGQIHGPEAKHALNELLSLSKNSVFDQACSEWLHNILVHFNAVKLKHEGYKHYLYSILASSNGQSVGELVVAALQYSLLHGALTDGEWRHLKSALRYTNHQDLRQMIDLLSKATLAKIQSQPMFKQQVAEVLALAKKGELGLPLKIKPGYVIGLLLSKVQRDFPEEFMFTYYKYHEEIEKPARLAKYISNYITGSSNPERYQLLSLYLTDIYSSDVKLNKRDANKLFTMLQDLRPIELPENSTLMADWQNIVINNKTIISDIVQHSSAATSKKSYWLSVYEQKQDKVGQLSL